ncbi:MAG: 4Fe-4S dicluster domain-containing protein [Thermoguttaceae bacterium]
MSELSIQIGGRYFLPRTALDDLIGSLCKDGYTVLGPMVVDGAISFEPIQSASDLPKGIKDQQDGGTYRLVSGDENLNFEYVVGPQGPKRHFFPANLQLFKFHIEKNRFELDAGPPQVPKVAFLGVRPCELAAIKVQDRVFGLGDPGVFRCESEPWYMQSRQESLLIAVNCTRPGGACFCASWDTGPKATEGFDLALTELREGFLFEVGTNRGAAIAEKLPIRSPSGAELELADLKLQRAREHMGRELNTEGLKELLDQCVEFPEWNDVAQHCLSCGNCTMVCPTCFCCTVTDTTDLSGEKVTRTRQWESCYTHQFTYTPSGPDRNSIRGRYRHWMRHKLSTWWDQFGMSGCVGCGRCITWCPVGIDLTEQAQILREASVKHLRTSTINENED